MLARTTGLFVDLFERVMPDPFLFAVILTIATALLAFLIAPHHTITDVLGAWYAGIFSILEFALQMILVLVTGYALANSVAVKRGLAWIADRATSARRAVVTTFLISAVACWLNWGFGLVVAALVAREMAKRVRVDFAWLVASAYSGFLVWACGLSSSIALAQATPHNKLNIVEKLTGVVLPLDATIFAPFSWIPVVVLVIVMAILLAAMQPTAEQTQIADPARLQEEDAPEPQRERTFASALENAWPLNLLMAIAGLVYLFISWSSGGIRIDINSVIFIFLIAGLLLHWRPIAYVNAVNKAARVTGPLILQYPIYGGIMGIMTATGLAGVIAKAFIAISTTHTLAFWSYIASVIISFFVPSGGGHWAVQGPFVVPAAMQLHASQAASAMGVAMGEQVTNMVQPFWALPVIAIAGVGIRRVMGFTVVCFVVSLVVYGAALLLLVK